MLVYFVYRWGKALKNFYIIFDFSDDRKSYVENFDRDFRGKILKRI